MREILFRGKQIGNGKWVEGYCVYDESGQVTKEPTEYIYSLNKHPCGWGLIGYAVDPETVGQYTGLTDKNGTNGTKIFEGDIGRYKQTDGAKRNGKPIICTGKVVYNAKTASFAMESKDEAGCKYFDYFPIKDLEVIGNIHDNPELLGG